jgi:tetratricopeptide (TPR) repeat protein
LILTVLLALPALLPLSCHRDPGRKIVGDFSPGAFEGTGAEALTAELRLLKPALLRKDSLPVLSGEADFEFRIEDGKETVITLEEGGEALHWREDPLTGTVWTVKARVKKEVPRAFDFKSATGTLRVAWVLSDPESGRALENGTLTLADTRGLGGYLGETGSPGRRAQPGSPKPPDGTEIRETLLLDLANAAALTLADILGPRFGERDLALGKDPRSRTAKVLVAKGDWDGAARIWNELATLNPGYHPALYNLGLHFERRGDLVSAWRCFRSAFVVDQNARYRESLSRVATVLMRQNRLPKPDAGFLF